MGNGDAVYPVFFTVFEQEVPDVLRPINGVQYTDEKLDSIKKMKEVILKTMHEGRVTELTENHLILRDY